MANKRVHGTPVKSGVPAKTWVSLYVRSPPAFKSMLEGYVSAVQKSCNGYTYLLVLIKVKSDLSVSRRTSDDTIFFNEPVKGNYRVRKRVGKDLTGESLLLLFWNGHIEVVEGKWYLVAAVYRTSYYGNELGCSKSTINVVKCETWKCRTQKINAIAQFQTDMVLLENVDFVYDTYTPSTTAAAQNRGENVGEEVVVEKNKESRQQQQQQQQQPSQTEQQHDTPSTTAAQNGREYVDEEVVGKRRRKR